MDTVEIDFTNCKLTDEIHTRLMEALKIFRDAMQEEPDLTLIIEY